MNNINKSWQEFFEQECNKPYFEELMDKVKKEYAEHTCYPAYDNIFNAFALTGADKVKVVILGQDPYHGPGQAQGLSFSVPAGQKLPPSLVNMGKELESEMGYPCIAPAQGDLTKWAEQGVLLLNTTLTVREHEAASHSKLGWGTFTDAVISYIDEQSRPIVFMLWGSHAQKKKELLSNPNHLALCSAHPSPLSASRGFFGNGHFKKANEWLIEQREEPIDWKLTD